MAARKIKNQPASLIGSPVAIYYDPDYSEYQVRISGRPDDTYFTDDKADAFSTAQHMRNTAFLTPKKNPAKRAIPVKRKNQARTQARAEGYVRRPSQITKAKPSKRLTTRRIKNLRVPMGVFPNPSSKAGDYEAARELFLFGSNDGNLYRSRTTAIIDNLAKKYVKGIFDAEKSLILWKYWADDAAKRYAKDYGGSFDVPTRKLVAKMAADYYAEHIAEESVKFEKVKKNPTETRKTIVVEKSANGKTGWSILAAFPDSTGGSNRAIEYAKAYAIKDPKIYLRVSSANIRVTKD